MYIYIDIYMYKHTEKTVYTMEWLRLVASIILYICFAGSSLFYRSLLQKRPVILSILQTEATPHVGQPQVWDGYD